MEPPLSLRAGGRSRSGSTQHQLKGTWRESRRALRLFEALLEDGLRGIADGDHFFDLLADDAIFEYVITVPGYPRRVIGRAAVAELYRPYGDTFFLDRCFDFAVQNHRETHLPGGPPTRVS